MRPFRFRCCRRAANQPPAQILRSQSVRVWREMPRSAKPVISPSLGPGPSRTPMYMPEPRPISTIPPQHVEPSKGRCGDVVDDQQCAIDRQPDDDDVGDCADPRSLSQRNPQHQNENPGQNARNANRHRGMQCHALVHRFPRRQAKTRSHLHANSESKKPKAEQQHREST